MILCIDVQYSEDIAYIAGGIFKDWNADEFEKVYKTTLSNIADYEPGQFYKRELPCVLKLLNQIKEKIEVILIDGYCFLSLENKEGFGAHLYNALNKEVPVIGLAKNPFRGNDFSKSLFRGGSIKPVYITSIGMEPDEAYTKVLKLHGDYRIPTLVKKIDSIVREMEKESHDFDIKIDEDNLSK